MEGIPRSKVAGLVLSAMSACAVTASGAEFHVAPGGADTNPGTRVAPFRTLAAAQRAARAVAGKEAVTVRVADGVVYLPETLVLTAADSGTAAHPVTWMAEREGGVVLSGGARLDLTWSPCSNGIFKAAVPAGLAIDQLFINGQRQRMARYPNFDAGKPTAAYQGFAADAFAPERAARWADPAGGYIHAMHRGRWGGYHYRITGKNADGTVAYEGGWQNNRQMGMHKDQRMVENIFEELDAPGEWFHDATGGMGDPPDIGAHRGSSERPGQRPGPTTDTTGTEGRAGPLARPQGTLCLIPSRPDAGHDGMSPSVFLSTSVVEVVRLRHLVELRGSQAAPVRFLTLKGFVFRHAARTFMDTKEPLLRSDWAIYRGGAVRIEGAEDVALADCEFDQVGGNAVFVSGYNRRVAVRGCHIHDAGASGVCFVGDPKAVRDPLFEYGQTHDLAAIDRTPGPKTEDYPADCVVEDCLIHGIGRVERQPAGVQISMARRITVRDCSIHDCARAGINIGDGTWGGHLIEGCDVFDTVLETHDHGSFNSWGRDRYWMSNHRGVSQPAVKADPRLPFLDAMETTVIRASRWRCDHGWDIDLDDGSSNYAIHDNLLLAGGLKFREGYGRRAWNNVIVNNGFHPHVWFEDSGDVFATNIVMRAHAPIGMPAGWGRGIDGNLFASEAARAAHLKSGGDAGSIAGDPQFVDPASGDFRVRDGSPALRLGFRNFPMDRFGVKKPALKAIAKTPPMPVPAAPVGPRTATRTQAASVWLGATLHGLEGEEFSAFGVSKEDGGVQLVDVPPGSAAAAAGLQKNDLVQAVNDRKVTGTADLFAALAAVGDAPVRAKVVRNQAAQTIALDAAPYVKVETSHDGKAFPSLAPPAAASGAVGASGRTANDPLASLVDGKLARGYGPVFPNGVTDGAYRIDLGTVREVASATSWSFNQGGNRGRQIVTVHGSASADDPGWNTADRARFVPLGTIDTAAAATADFTAASLRARPGSTLGRFRWIVWRVHPVTPIGENTAFQELAVEVAK
jgi:hypothetical protein